MTDPILERMRAVWREYSHDAVMRVSQNLMITGNVFIEEGNIGSVPYLMDPELYGDPFAPGVGFATGRYGMADIMTLYPYHDPLIDKLLGQFFDRVEREMLE